MTLKEAGIETAKGGSEPKAVDVKIDSIDTTHVINTDELKANYEIYVRKVAPLGDPVEVTVRGYELSLRKADADLIEVK